MKAFKLDAYAVLDLKPGVPESDIKKCYRVKSLLIHPDKTSNPQAPDAFDRLKKAQTMLMDEKVFILFQLQYQLSCPPSIVCQRSRNPSLLESLIRTIEI